jgi:hypothetical protein
MSSLPMWSITRCRRRCFADLAQRIGMVGLAREDAAKYPSQPRAA